MNIKNTTRVFWGLVIAAAFTLAACNQPNNTKTPTVNDDELGLKAKVLKALETNATEAGIKFDKNSTTATVTNEVLLSKLFNGVELTGIDVAITVKADKDTAKTVEFDKASGGKFTVDNAKDTTKGDTFVVTVVFKNGDKKTTTVTFKVLNKKGVTAAPVPQEFPAEATEDTLKNLIKGHESQSALNLAELDPATTATVKLPKENLTIGSVTAVTGAWALTTANGASLNSDGDTLTLTGVAANTDVILTVTLKKDGYTDKPVTVTLHTKAAAPVPQEFPAEATEDTLKNLIKGHESQSALNLAELDPATTATVKLPKENLTIGSVTAVTGAWALTTANGASLNSDGDTLTLTGVAANTDVVLTVTLKKDGYTDKPVTVTLHTKNN